MPDSSTPLPAAIESALARLVEGPEPEFWSGVARLCAAHPEDARRIEVAARGVHRLMGRGDTEPTGRRSPGSVGDLHRGDRVGPFVILEEIGQGGMGSVYLADQREPVRRRVALKVIKPGMDTKAVLARFEAERQALAMMDHSCIAKVFEAGATPQGRPYFAMEYVKGIPITRYCDDNRLSLDDRLSLFRQVCGGVQHAHTKGVIHRDLTPNNVLVTVQDGKATPKIIDFGLARATDHKLTEKTVFTEQGVILGTPEYMSPEQAGLNALDVDMRSDVYTLGVLLYELLTGGLPFESRELRAAGYDGMCAIIRDRDPLKPSTKITGQAPDTEAVARLRQTDSQRLLRRLRGDLDWIVLKCLEKDRTRRYETASELAADVQRHLDDEPVLARAPSVGYQLGKFARRHRGRLAAAGAVFAALVVGLGVSLHYWREAAANAVAARQHAALALSRQREFDQLAGVVLYRRAVESERQLHPAWPERIPAMRRWLTEQADPLLAMRPEIEQTLADLRARALPGAPDSSERRVERFAEESQRFLHDTLGELVGDLRSFESAQRTSVKTRLEWAQRIEALTRAHPRARASWQQARAAIARADGVVASELYAVPPIDLQPQTGLVPIGMNPRTRLWEFYELRSAWDGSGDPAAIEIPEHAATGAQAGHIDVGDDTGIVFVLLPGGTFTMGAQRTDRSAANFDPAAADNESPHDVTLAPFFMARHELTQGQWSRLWTWDQTGQHPSYCSAGRSYGGNRVSAAHPVDSVSWEMCEVLLTRHGLTLPTEAQWEYGCRGGTTTVWWTGDDRESLRDAVNLADQAAKDSGAPWPEIDDWPELRDGFVVHAPVSTLRANPFGLHHVHGNVFEWCLDWFGTYALPVRPGDGLRETATAGPREGAPLRIDRGGSFTRDARSARSSHREASTPTLRSNHVGVRAARSLTGG